MTNAWVMRLRGAKFLPHFLGLPLAQMKARFLMDQSRMTVTGIELKSADKHCTIDTWGRVNWHHNICEWKESDEGIWESDCGIVWEFNYDGPEGNNMKYCLHCGGIAREVPYVEDDV